MALKLSEVAKARRRLAKEHETTKQALTVPPRTPARSPVFVSSRSVSVA